MSTTLVYSSPTQVPHSARKILSLLSCPKFLLLPTKPLYLLANMHIVSWKWPLQPHRAFHFLWLNSVSLRQGIGLVFTRWGIKSGAGEAGCCVSQKLRDVRYNHSQTPPPQGLRVEVVINTDMRGQVLHSRSETSTQASTPLSDPC